MGPEEHSRFWRRPRQRHYIRLQRRWIERAVAHGLTDVQGIVSSGDHDERLDDVRTVSNRTAALGEEASRIVRLPDRHYWLYVDLLEFQTSGELHRHYTQVLCKKYITYRKLINKN